MILDEAPGCDDQAWAVIFRKVLRGDELSTFDGLAGEGVGINIK